MTTFQNSSEAKNSDKFLEMTKTQVTSQELSNLVVEGMQEKKASNIVILDLREIKQAVADFFVICSGNSVNQVDAITDSIEEVIYKAIQEDPWRKEGKENKEWILLDYVDVVAHIFRKDRREFYDLEDLWGDANITRIEDL